MRKLFAIVFLIFFMAGSAWALEPKHTINLELWSYESGTTYSNMNPSGTSTMYLQVKSTHPLYGDSQTIRMPNGGYWVLQMDDFSLNSGHTWYHNTGATFEIYYEVSLINDATHWVAAEQIPIILNFAISGTTEWIKPIWFKPPPANYMRVYFTSGITGFDEASLKLMIGENDGQWEPPQPIYIGSQTLVCDYNSGISTLTVPDGTRYVEVEVSGGSLFYTISGDSPLQTHRRLDNTSTSYPTYIVLGKDEAEKLKLGNSENIITVTVTYLTGKPGLAFYSR